MKKKCSNEDCYGIVMPYKKDNILQLINNEDLASLIKT